MKATLSKYLNNRKGATLIELLLYIAIFLVLTPILLTVSIQAIRFDEQHNVEKQVNADSQFVIERIYDLISVAKKVDVQNTILNEEDGKLTLVMQDDSVVVIEKQAGTDAIQITEGGLTSNLSSNDLIIDSLFFERITDQLGDPEVVLGINTRLHASGPSEFSVLQEYVISSNLERADFDGDGCIDYIDSYVRHPQCCGDSDGDGACDELDNCVLEYNPFQEDFDYDNIGDSCDSSGALTPFNCASETELLSLIDQFPPLSSAQLKQALMSASPLSPNVLNGLIDRQRDNPENIMGEKHFEALFINNTALPTDVYTNFLTLDSDDLSLQRKQNVIDAHNAAGSVAWDDQNQCVEITYDVAIVDDEQSVEYSNASIPLDSNGNNVSDTFFVCAMGGSTDIVVTIYDGWSTDSALLSGIGNEVQILGFHIIFDSLVGNNYAFIVTTGTNAHALNSIKFDFGEGADASCSLEDTYTTTRQLDYFPGGCQNSCGDVGTGIVVGNVFTDTCYRTDINYYLHDDSAFDPDDAEDAMDTLAPLDRNLCNYDNAADSCEEVDSQEPGTLIQKGYLPAAPDVRKYQDFILASDSTSDFHINGDVTLKLRAAMKDFENKLGILYVQLLDDDDSQVIATESISLSSWSSTFKYLTYTFSGLNYTVPAGNKLVLRVWVDDASDDDMWIAYDTLAERSRIYFPTRDFNHPDWCYIWNTSEDNDEVNPAFMGSTIPDEETVYWEKEFKALLADSQIQVLESITISGEVAYQSTTQFFCDTLSASCPMVGTLLLDSQDVELYNWVTDKWNVVGELGLDGTISDQQTFEVIYGDDGPENKVDEYVGGDDGRIIKARMQMHWVGNPPVEGDSAPSFMLIDYFVVHLKW